MERAVILGVLTVCAAVMVDPAGARAQQTAEYSARFDAAWSASTHPVDFPASAHFSGLIGATHNDSVTFWQGGGIASAGIESMAETGSKSALRDEVSAAIDAGQAGTVISGPGISRSPGAASVEFTATQSFSRVTIVSMVAPSPDWFVGVSALELFQDGRWITETRLDLFTYDAGTDSGLAFTSLNDDTMPREAIGRLVNESFGNGVPLGTLTLTRRDAPPPTSFVRGDSNADTLVDVSDALHVLGYLFTGGPAPPCLESADFRDDDTLDIGSAVFLLGHLFLGNPPPSSPFPDCGVALAEGLGCASYPGCEVLPPG